MKEEIYENYPARVVILSNLIIILWYAIGAIILTGFNILIAVVYLFFCILLYIFLLKNGCNYCYYYGKWCGDGKGKIVPLFFKKRHDRDFSKMEFSNWDVFLVFLPMLLPVIGAIILLIINFSLVVMILLILCVVISLVSIIIMHGALICKHCKQGRIGCPAGAGQRFMKELKEK